MAIKTNEVKRLWGRSGGRCAICRLELSAVESDAVLGEMAHIIAQSPDGPRCDAQFPQSELNKYDNLILLCPTHHQEIDSNPNEWSVQRLLDTKSQHESWIQRQFEQGLLPPTILDNHQFRKSRISYWQEKKGHLWIVASLTPLDIIDEVIDPFTSEIERSIKEVQYPEYFQAQGIEIWPNPHFTEPSSYGIVNEDFRKLSSHSVGFRIEVWRNGNIEFVICADFLLKLFNLFKQNNIQQQEKWNDRGHRLTQPKDFVRYYDFADAVVPQLKSLLKFFHNSNIPFNDVVASIVLVGFKNLGLIVPAKHTSDLIIGRTVEADPLEYSVVINRKIHEDHFLDIVFKRLINCFGLDVPSVYTPDGELLRPRRFNFFNT